MGHYYSEMCCDRCGALPCACPKPPEPVYNLDDYVIDGLKIVTIREFKEYYGLSKMRGSTLRIIPWTAGMYGRPVYCSMKEAEEQLLKMVKAAAKEVRAKLKLLVAQQRDLEKRLFDN